MKNVNTYYEVEAKPSQNKVKYVIFDNPSLDKISGYIFPNRREVESRMNVNVSGSYVTSSDIVNIIDVGEEGFLNKIISSQIGVNNFQETRLLSPTKMKKRAVEAIQKEIERRKKLIEIEEAETDL